jgi:hypothetical protein
VGGYNMTEKERQDTAYSSVTSTSSNIQKTAIFKLTRLVDICNLNTGMIM